MIRPVAAIVVGALVLAGFAMPQAAGRHAPEPRAIVLAGGETGLALEGVHWRSLDRASARLDLTGEGAAELGKVRVTVGRSAAGSIKSLTMTGPAAALDQLTDPDVWAQYLSRGESLARYSFRNQLLIGMQCPDATDVAGYVEWQDRGRQVRKGETGILIFAPLTRRAVMEDGKVLDRKPEPGEETVTKMRGLRITSVFDIGQTDPIEGKPFKPAKDASPKSLGEIREVIATVAGEHADAILDALDQAAELVTA